MRLAGIMMHVRRWQVPFQLRYQEPFPLPPATDSRVLADVELSGVDAARAKYNDTGKLSVHFRCTHTARGAHYCDLQYGQPATSATSAPMHHIQLELHDLN